MALCVTAEETQLCRQPLSLHTPNELTRWIVGHCAATGHQDYEQTVRATVRAAPGAWQ
ncbi:MULTISPECIES: hypothetical protein [unclassified Streptomyces]|uniref:hypothetical protein n=1 Tax=unclassified Streptomyces TaxID=2593676 RepID=UPI000A42CCE0|nr:hypothetical protein [Streptomyces sp. NRRL F-5630]